VSNRAGYVAGCEGDQPRTFGRIGGAGGWVCEFHRRGDRYAWCLTAESPGGARLLESREGSSDEAWPPSPPLQQMSRELIAGQPVILLVGAAGRSHWSCSWTFDESGAQAWAEFACRLTERPKFLGITLDVRAAGLIEWLSPTQLLLELASSRLRLELMAGQCGDREKPVAARFEVHGRTLVGVVDVDTVPCTAVWKLLLSVD
jgi:hypothetical protein